MLIISKRKKKKKKYKYKTKKNKHLIGSEKSQTYIDSSVVLDTPYHMH